MAKQFITEAQRMQKLAGILTESQLNEVKDSDKALGILFTKDEDESYSYNEKAIINLVKDMGYDDYEDIAKEFTHYFAPGDEDEMRIFRKQENNPNLDVTDLTIGMYKKNIAKEFPNKPIDEMALPEMARTAGTGGAYTITEKGEEILKQAKATGKAPEGIKNSEIAALVFLFKAKKEGKRVQKMDYAKEKGVDQPAVNSTFNGLEMKELATKEGYTSKQQEPKTSRPRTDISAALSDLDIEEGKKPLKEDIFNDIDQDLMHGGFENQEDQIEYLKEVISYCQAKINEIESNLDESKKALSEDKDTQAVIDFLNSHIDKVKKYMLDHLVFDGLKADEVEKRKKLVNSVQNFEEDGNYDASPDKEIGVSFRFAEDVNEDPSFYEEEGEPEFFDLAGKKMVAIWYNI